MKRLFTPILLMMLLAMACQLGAPAATSIPPTPIPPVSTVDPATAIAMAAATIAAATASAPTASAPTASAPTAAATTAAPTAAPATNTVAPTSAPTSAPAKALRVAVRAADDSVQIVDTGVAAGQASQAPALLPMGGAVGDTLYVLDFKDQPKAQVVDASGTKTLDFVQQPDYGLAVWPGNGTDKPRLAWATSPMGQPPATTQLFYANVDGSGLTMAVSETITVGQPPYQLVAQRWSADGQSLYYSREPNGIGGYIPFAGASSLYRYDLASKSVTELIPFNVKDVKFLCLEDLAPDASLVVGHCGDPMQITVHSLAGGADQTLAAPSSVTDFRLAGGARFSPDAKRVAFALAKGDPSGEQGWIALSDGLSGSSTLVDVSPASHYYTVAAWLNETTLLIQDNSLACNPDCTNSLWTVALDGSNLTKLTDGNFLTLVK